MRRSRKQRRAEAAKLQQADIAVTTFLNSVNERLETPIQLGNNDRLFMTHLVVKTGDEMIRQQPKGSPDAYVNFQAVQHVEESVVELRRLVPELPSDWIVLYTKITFAALLMYLGLRDREDLMAPLDQALEDRKSQSVPANQALIPTDELLQLIDGPQNLRDPEFRRRAPHLAHLADNLTTSSDTDITKGQGIAERERRILSGTRAGEYQALSDEDGAVLIRLALDIAAARKTTRELTYLSALELEAIGAWAEQLHSKYGDSLKPEEIAGLPSVIDAVADELAGRP